MKATFAKSERLCNNKLIGSIFSTGHHLYTYPYKLMWVSHSVEQSNAIQVAVSVPKRRFKKAVDRNRLKRQIKEAYRLQKHILTKLTATEAPNHYAIMIVYMGKTAEPYTLLHQRLGQLLQQFVDVQTTSQHTAHTSH